VSFWVQSRYQIQGRGQRGRKWDSSPGNLFLTGCFSSSKKILPGQLSILTGVFFAKILKQFLPAQNIALKWPNDLLLNRKKCGGILIEIDEYIYIGVGINITSHPDNTPMQATHLQACDPVDTNALILKIIDTFPNLEELGNFEKVRHQWWEFAKDSLSCWRLREPIKGDILGVDEQGQLLIKSKNGDIIKRHQTFSE
jgi:BirA family biotin operon repressor/biotin-[acetyl-CoA-carboxylase] ligase